MIQLADALGRSLPKPRLREICKQVELSQEETEYFLLRCADRLTADQIEGLHRVTYRQQRYLTPLINNKLRVWLENNVSFLTKTEVEIINRALEKHKLQTIE